MKKILNGIFLICVCTALALAASYVLVEAAAVITANGSMAVWAETYLETPVCIMCSVSAVAAFVMSYLFGWKSGD